MRCGLPAGALRGLRATSPTSTSAPAAHRARIKPAKQSRSAGNKAFGAYLNTTLPSGIAAANLSSARHTVSLWAHSLPVGRVKGLPLRLVCAASDADAVAPYAVE